MKWAALITWVLTAGGGVVVLGVWVKNGGLAQSDQPGRRIRPALIFSHFALAAAGLVVWIIYIAADKDGLAWAGFVLLVPVALLGFTMLALWLQRRRAAATPDASMGSEPAEQRFPVPVVI